MVIMHVIVLNFEDMSHFSFIDYMFCDASMFVEQCCNENININILFIVCIADHY